MEAPWPTYRGRRVNTSAPEASLRQAFSDAGGAFARAALVCETTVRHFVFGGKIVRMHACGPAVTREMTRPFAHLEIPAALDTPCALEIRIWEEDATRDATPDGATLEVSTGGRFVRHRSANCVSMLDRVTGSIVAAVCSPERWHVHERGKPLARLLTEWYADQGLGVMHTALVARQGRGVLLTGRGGSGKSTLSVAALRTGAEFLGAAYAALEFLATGAIVGHSVYNAAFLSPGATARFPEIAPHLTASRDAEEPKSVVTLADVGPSTTDLSPTARSPCANRTGPHTRCAARLKKRAPMLGPRRHRCPDLRRQPGSSIGCHGS